MRVNPLPSPASSPLYKGISRNLSEGNTKLLSQIDNHEKRSDPTEDAELDEMVLDQTFCRRTAKTIYNHILKIPQKSGEHPTTGEINITGTHPLDDLWRHGVHDVANQSDRGNDSSGLVDKGFVVASNRHTRFRASLLIDAIIVITLGKRQKEGHEEGHHHQPMGNPYIRSKTTCQHPHNKTDGNDRYIQDGVLLQTNAIADIH